jgi:heme exporter protein C
MTRTQLIGLLAAIFLFVAIYFVFSFAEIETTMLEVQKIFYFHISSALTLFLAFGVTCLFSILYLIKRVDKYDTTALVSTEIGIVFGVVVFTTGPIWARFAWNTWWNWEPRLTSALILWLTYIGYLILRSALAEEKKRVYSAVLGIIGFLNVPIVYFSVELWQGGLHPDTTTKMNLPPTMQIAWLISWFALTLLYLFLLMFRYRAEQMKLELDTIQYQQMGES